MNQADLHQAAEQLRTCFSTLEQQLAAAPEDDGRQQTLGTMHRVTTLLREIESREALASSFIDIAGVLLIALHRDGRIATVNREGAELLGYTERELIDADWFERCIPREDRDDVRSVFEALLRGETGGVQLYENAVVCRGGERRLIQWHNSLWRDGRGEVIGTISSGRDVTDHRRAEDAAEDHEARLQAVVNTAVDAIVTIDERGIIESVNPATEKMFGFTAKELVGRNVSVLMPAPYRAEHDGYIRRYLETGVKHIIDIGREVTGKRKDSTVFPIDLAVSEFFMGGRRMFTGMIRDISDRKALERQVLDVATEEQQRIGRDLHDSLGQELTGIAFLTGVLQKSLAAQQHPKAQDAMELVNLVNQAIDHTRALVRGLCPVNLESDGLMIALEQLANDVRDVHGVRCDFECPSPVLIEDHNAATQLFYIAQEAVTNAVRHGKPKRITITLAPARQRIRLTVRDDGRGIKKNAPGHTGRTDRNGRGMHIMQYRARMIGGTVSVDSQPESGACVTCTFTPAG